MWYASRDSKGRGAAAGVDGVSPIKFRENLDHNLSIISDSVRSGNYEFAPLRFFPIKKANDKHRIISIPTVGDRLVQRVLANYLSVGDKLHIVNSVSFGFIPSTGASEKGVWGAVKRAGIYAKSSKWVIKTDIEDFFNTIERSRIETLIEEAEIASPVKNLLRKVVRCEIKPPKYRTDREILKKSTIERDRGLRQGMPLSPLLSNLFLRELDKEIIQENVMALRYADDLILFFNSKDQALQKFDHIKSRLEKINLTLPEIGEKGSKSKIQKSSEQIDFLGIAISIKGGRISYRVPEEVVSGVCERIKGLSRYDELVEKGLNLQSYDNNIFDVVTGYKSSYWRCDNFNDFNSQMIRTAKSSRKEVLRSAFGARVWDSLSQHAKNFVGKSKLDTTKNVGK